MILGKKRTLWKKKEKNGGYRSKTGIMEADRRENLKGPTIYSGKGKILYYKATAASMRRSDSHPSFYATSCHDPWPNRHSPRFSLHRTTPYKNAFFSFKSRRNLPHSLPPIGFSLIQNYVLQKPYKIFFFFSFYGKNSIFLPDHLEWW